MDVEIDETKYDSNSFFNTLKYVYEKKMGVVSHGSDRFGIGLLLCLSERFDTTHLFPVKAYQDLKKNATEKIIQISLETQKSYNFTEMVKMVDKLNTIFSENLKNDTNFVKHLITPLRAFGTGNFKNDTFDVYDTTDFIKESLGPRVDVKAGVDGTVTLGYLKFPKVGQAKVSVRVAIKSPTGLHKAFPLNLATNNSSEWFFVRLSKENYDRVFAGENIDVNIINDLSSQIDQTFKILNGQIENDREILQYLGSYTEVSDKNPMVKHVDGLFHELLKNDEMLYTVMKNNRQIITEYIIGKYCINQSPNYQKYFPTFHGVTWNLRLEQDHDGVNMRDLVSNYNQTLLEDAKISFDDILASYDDKNIKSALETNAYSEKEGPLNRESAAKIVMSHIDSVPSLYSQANNIIPASDVLRNLFIEHLRNGSKPTEACCLLLDCIVQLCDAFKMPQKTNKMMHNDLHLSNIEITQSNKTIMNTILFGDRFHYHSKRSVKIYDFGRSSAIFGNLIVSSGYIVEDNEITVDVKADTAEIAIKKDPKIQFMDTSSINLMKKKDMIKKNILDQIDGQTNLRKQVTNNTESKKKKQNFSDAWRPSRKSAHRFVIKDGSLTMIGETAKDDHFSEYWDIYSMLMTSMFIIVEDVSKMPWENTQTHTYAETLTALKPYFTRDTRWYDVTNNPLDKSNIKRNPSLDVAFRLMKIIFHFLAMAAHVSKSGAKNTHYDKRCYTDIVREWFKMTTDRNNFKKINKSREYKIIVNDTEGFLTLASIAKLAISLRYTVDTDTVTFAKEGCEYVGHVVDLYFKTADDTPNMSVQNNRETDGKPCECFDPKMLSYQYSKLEKLIIYDGDQTLYNDNILFSPKLYPATVTGTSTFFTKEEHDHIINGEEFFKQTIEVVELLNYPKLADNLRSECFFLLSCSKNIHDTYYKMCLRGYTHLNTLKKLYEYLNLNKSSSFDEAKKNVRETLKFPIISSLHISFVGCVKEVINMLNNQTSTEYTGNKEARKVIGKNTGKLCISAIYFVRYALSMKRLLLHLVTVSTKEYEKVVKLLGGQ